jgi:uncharacterized protein (DUF1697 family)
METYIAILRGINVSGYKIIKMDELREAFGSLNYKNVRTYIQSGNVVFDYKKTRQNDLKKSIEKRIFETFGFEVPVIVKEKKEVEYILKNNPFVNKRKEDSIKLHVTFLAEEPDQANVNKIKELKYEGAEFIVSGKAVYLFCPDRYGYTKLNNSFFETKLKVAATTRNWRTVNELANIANS